VIGEPLGGPQAEIGQRDLVGVVAETRATGVADAVLPAVDGEAVQMLPAPPERGLQRSSSSPTPAGVARSAD